MRALQLTGAALAWLAFLMYIAVTWITVAVYEGLWIR